MPHIPLFSSLAAMLTSPASPLSIAPGDVIASNAMEGGLSGALLERLTIHSAPPQPPRHAILKQLEPATNWLMRASGDTACREMQLTQSPLWERMPATILAPVLAGMIAPDGTAALLLDDMGDAIFPAAMVYDETAPDPAFVSHIIDRLAALHAAFWDAPGLRALPWLTTSTASLFMLTPEPLADAGLSPDGKTYGDAILRMWPHLWPLLDPEDAVTLQQTLAHPATLIEAYERCPATLAHGDAWLANMGALGDRLILLDWALTTAGPATIDSLWFAHTWHGLDPDAVLREHRVALLRHGVTAVADDATWDLLTALGWIRTTLMGAEWLVRDVRGATHDAEYLAAVTRLRHWCHTAATLLRQWQW